MNDIIASRIMQSCLKYIYASFSLYYSLSEGNFGPLEKNFSLSEGNLGYLERDHLLPKG